MLHWLERVQRLLPDDGVVGLTLGSFWLAGGDAGGAVALLGLIAGRGGRVQAWAALAAVADVQQRA